MEASDGTASDETDGGPVEAPSLGALTYAVFYKQVVLLVRYPVNTATRFLSILAFFSLVFFGGRAVAAPQLADSLDGIIVGFFIWTLTIVSYSGLALNVTREAQWGTLERLFMSPLGFRTVMSVKTLANVSMTLVWGAVTLLAMMAISGHWLALDPTTVLPLSLLTLASVVGIGFLFAGLALRYKRIENAFQLVQFGFVGLIAAPVERAEWLKLLPVSHGSYLLRRAMSDGVRLWEFEPTETGLLVVTALSYLFLGYYSFHRAQRIVRRQGSLGQY